MNEPSSRRAVIIGASSGIGEALARTLAAQGWQLGLTARRLDRLEALASELAVPCACRAMDVSAPQAAIEIFSDLLDETGGADLVILNAGQMHPNPSLDWEPEAATLAVNVTGFAALAGATMRHFFEQGSGHLVGVTSVVAVRGGANAPAYAASKAFESHYLDTMRLQAARRALPIHVTEIRPGFVETALVAGIAHQFWVATPATAARQIVRDIARKRRCVYVTRRWQAIAWLMRVIPESLYIKLVTKSRS